VGTDEDRAITAQRDRDRDRDRQNEAGTETNEKEHYAELQFAIPSKEKRHLGTQVHSCTLLNGCNAASGPTPRRGDCKFLHRPRTLISAVTLGALAGGPEHSLRAILDRGGGVRGAAGPLVFRERSAGPAAVPNFRHLQPVIVTSGCKYGGQSIQACALPPLSILSCSQLTCSHRETRPIQRQLPFPAHGNRLRLTANGKRCRQSRNEVTDKQTVSSMW
jgi:hypothetical protein